jgi:chlorobactene glucosyltransferase
VVAGASSMRGRIAIVRAVLARVFGDPTLPIVLAAYGAWGAWRATRSYRSLPLVPAPDQWRSCGARPYLTLRGNGPHAAGSRIFQHFPPTPLSSPLPARLREGGSPLRGAKPSRSTLPRRWRSGAIVPATAVTGLANVPRDGNASTTAPSQGTSGSEAARTNGVSVVIPARDEAHNLGSLLGSLRVIAGDPVLGFLDAVVVDDASTDGTGDIARQAGVPSLSVVRLEESDKPDGWVGKTNACQVGAAATSGDWLLFLDADVTLGPLAIAGALAFARERNLDAFSMFLRQRCETLWERLLLPYAFQQFFAGVDPERMRDPSSDEAVFNGQFILIRRAVYNAIGGHFSVRADVAEDVAIARVLKAQGYRIDVGRGEALADVRMYRSFASIRRGFGKNAYAILADEPVRGIQVAAASTGAGMTIPLLGMAVIASGRARMALALAGFLSWGAQAFLMRPWLRAFVVPNGDAFLHPLSALAFQTIGMESMVRSVGRLGVTWKGRRYIEVSTEEDARLRPRDTASTGSGAV